MKGLKTLAIVAAVTGATPAFAQSLGGGGCSGDVVVPALSTFVNCYGRFSGNSLNNSSNSDINTALTALGYAGPAVSYNAIPANQILTNLNGNTSINFPGLLNGVFYFGVHYGNGQGGPGNSTTFYKFNTNGNNVDILNLTLNASSTATLFAFTANSPVPEPATWALMMLGFGGMGYTLRRGRRASARIRFA